MRYEFIMLILLFLVVVTSSVPLPNPPQIHNSENDDLSSRSRSSGRHISLGSPSVNDALPTSTHLTPPVIKTASSPEEVNNAHITKEVRRVSFQIVEEVSGSKNLIFSLQNAQSSDTHLEPTEVEAPGTTPTILPLETTGDPISSIKTSTSVAYSVEIHNQPIIESDPHLPLTDATSFSAISETLENVTLKDDASQNLSSISPENNDFPGSSNDSESLFLSGPSIVLNTPHESLTQNPSIVRRTDRITVITNPSPAKGLPVSQSKPRLENMDIMLSDEPSRRQEPEKGSNFEKSEPSNSSQLKDEPSSSSKNSEKTSELENEEELVDGILNDKDSQGELQLSFDPNPAASQTKSSTHDLLEGKESLSDSEANLEHIKKEVNVKPSFLETRDVKPEAFFRITKQDIPVRVPPDENKSLPLGREQTDILESEIKDPSPQKTSEYTPGTFTFSITKQDNPVKQVPNENKEKNKSPQVKDGQVEKPEVPPTPIDAQENFVPALKRNSPPGKKDPQKPEDTEQFEDHPPFADLEGRKPGLPIEDSEENTFVMKPRVRHSERKDLTETQTQGYDGANEDSSEEVKNHRIHPKPQDPRVFQPSSKDRSPSGSHETTSPRKNTTRQENAKMILPSSDHIVDAKISGSSHLIPSVLESQSSEPILDVDYTPDSPMDPPRQERVSVPVSEPIQEFMGPGCVAAIVLGVLLCIAAALGGFVFIVYHRQTDIRPKVLSSGSCANSDSGGYLDDQRIDVAYVNPLDVPKGTPEDLVSLDNDSFLNSLESMTIQNLWTDSIRHTKL